jgi:hypothetical protein
MFVVVRRVRVVRLDADVFAKVFLRFFNDETHFRQIDFRHRTFALVDLAHEAPPAPWLRPLLNTRSV